MTQYLTPFLRSPMTDLSGGLISHQLLGRCQKYEMRMMTCLEHYGMDRGSRRCNKMIEDFKECQILKKQFGRFIAMYDERQKQIREGKLTGKKKYVSPIIDSY